MILSRLALHCIQLLSVGHHYFVLSRDEAEVVRGKTVTWRLARSTTYRLRSTRSPSFRLGSGAVAANQQDTTEDTSVHWAGTTEAFLPKLEQPLVTFADPELYKLYLSLSKAADSTSLPSPEMNHPQNLIYQKLRQNIDKHFGILIAFILLYITLRKVADVSLWTMQTNWKPHQQCASSIMRLGGSARDITGMTTSREVMKDQLLIGLTFDAEAYPLGLLQAKALCHERGNPSRCHNRNDCL